MADDQKAKLYKQIVSRTDDYMLLERMRVHGFWPEVEDLPDDPPDEAKERIELQDQIKRLRSEHSVAVDPEKALAVERKRRWEESKLRRAANKAEREAKRLERLEQWEAYRQQSLVFLGDGVSGGLEGKQSDIAELTRRGLPIMHDGLDVATMIGVELPKLRWLTFHRRATTLVHYHRFQIPKKSGGRRLISAPKKLLARAQRRVLDNIVGKLAVEPQAHGFVRDRSIVSGAAPHVKKAVVINVDLKDFFPSITFRRVKGLFAKVGYSEQVATVLALLCTEPPRLATEHDGKVYQVALGERMLPQGACTSPAITNVICRRLDRRLAGLARRHGFAYTRYADDLTFSGDKPRAAGRLLRSVRAILAEEGFAENADKTRVMRRGRRQEVTGLTVNDKQSLSRADKRALRAMLHNVAINGLAHENRGDHPDFAAYLRGRVAFACMVDPQSAPRLREALQRALSNNN